MGKFIVFPLVAVVGLSLWSCGDSGGSGQSSNTLAKGVCSDTCPKPCNADGDCLTSNGELCCDFGSDGKACIDAQLCPRQCTDDSKCDTVSGQACERVLLESPVKVCTDASDALNLCHADTDCTTAGDVCCAAYKEPVCLPADMCPKTCSASTDCNTTVGEICCDTLAKVDTTLAGSVCITPALVPCPKACKASSDCDGQICCGGFCKSSCPQECDTSSDCNGQICCKTKAAASPLASGGRPPGYPVNVGGTGTCAGEFACNDGTCVAASFHCDGFQDCSNGEDEVGCTTGTCSGFTCNDGSCIDATFRCDGFQDCSGGEDELNCPSTGNCLSGFMCNDGTCIDASFHCDGFQDCSGGEDEIGCTGTGTCSGMTGAACNTCCQQNYAAGAQQYIDALTSCACGTGICAPSCQSACPITDLSASPPPDCSTCLSDSCADTLDNCISTGPCSDFVTCLGGCL